MENKATYKTDARQAPECSDHPGKIPQVVLTPELMHYGKYVCPVCDKFLAWLATPESVKKAKPTFALGGVTFDAKTQIGNYVKEVLAGARLDTFLAGEQYDVMRDLLNWHPEAEQKIGVGVAGIKVSANDEFGKKARGFWLVRVDGSVTDFSYRKCLQGEQSYRAKFVAACRFAVKDHIAEFRDEFFRVAVTPTCALTGAPITQNDCHVDHTPPYTFDRIAQAFVVLNSLNPDDPSLTMGAIDGLLVPLFSSPTLRDKFVTFHNNLATLRVISPFANTSIVPKSLHENGVAYVN